MNSNCKLIFNDGGEQNVPKGTKLEEIEKKFFSNHPLSIMAFKVNNELKELNFKIEDDINNLEIIDISNVDGMRIYQRSLVFVFARALRDLFPSGKVVVEHSLSKGLYCQVKFENGKVASEHDIKVIEEEMRRIVALNEAFIQTTMHKDEAKKHYMDLGLVSKAKLLDYRKDDYVKIYKFGNMMDYFYGYMLPSSGKLDKFELMPYKEGIIIRHPTQYSNGEIPEFEEHAKLYEIHKEVEEWAEILNVSYIRNINDQIVDGSITNTILTVEALHEKKIIKIADDICKNDKRIILIAGPSSSGKTTFANRLMIQLGVNGLNPVTVSVDNYFVNRDNNPLDENGDYDFEHIDALDRHKFNQDIKSLLSGKMTKLPIFDFTTGTRKSETISMQIGPNQPIIIEGIHCLNPKLSEELDDDLKYKIYISCLTQLNIDEHNRIPTTDSRLLRRLVRDVKHRGNNGESTLAQWASVRRGEERNIFPFQESADSVFNSATMYELAAIKKHVKPVLESVEDNSKQVIEAKRLLKLLNYVLPLDDEAVIPNTAIVREFIGGNVFR